MYLGIVVNCLVYEEVQSKVVYDVHQCDQIRQFIALWATFQSLWQQFYAILVKLLKSFILLVKSFLGNFIDIWPFCYWSHWDVDQLVVAQIASHPYQTWIIVFIEKVWWREIQKHISAKLISSKIEFIVGWNSTGMWADFENFDWIKIFPSGANQYNQTNYHVTLSCG